MENKGEGRVLFALRRTPPKLFKAKRGGILKEVPVFEPFRESLPLQSGFYSFVIDKEGDFRVQRGNTRSHSSMAPGRRAAAAGRFEVNRMGRVIHVVCGSTDFKQYYQSPRDSPVRYVIQCFHDHEAFDLNPGAVFTFHQERFDTWHVTEGDRALADPMEHLRTLRDEGAGEEIARPFADVQVSSFEGYHPPRPPVLYPMHRDQIVAVLEDGDADDPFEYGPAFPRLSLATRDLRAGKNNFVIDREGWLIVGMTGHQILSGGGEVGGAGHLHMEASGEVNRVEFNFSGHYRPPLTGDYVLYVYRLLRKHPLVILATSCRFAGRIFKDCDAISTVLEFSRDELDSDEEELGWRIELSSM